MTSKIGNFGILFLVKVTGSEIEVVISFEIVVGTSVFDCVDSKLLERNLFSFFDNVEIGFVLSFKITLDSLDEVGIVVALSVDTFLKSLVGILVLED